MTQASKGQVEIVSNGTRSLVFIDGVQVPNALSFEVLTEPGEVPQRVKLTFIAEKITFRKAENREFATLLWDADSAKTNEIPSDPQPIDQVKCRLW